MLIREQKEGVSMKPFFQEPIGTPGPFSRNRNWNRTFLVELQRIGGLQQGGFQKGGFGGCFLGPKISERGHKNGTTHPKNRKKGTKTERRTPKTGTRAHSPKTALLQNRPFFLAISKGEAQKSPLFW